MIMMVIILLKRGSLEEMRLACGAADLPLVQTTEVAVQELQPCSENKTHSGAKISVTEVNHLQLHLHVHLHPHLLLH